MFFLTSSARDIKHGRILHSRVVLSTFAQHLVVSNYHKCIEGVELTSLVIHYLVVFGLK